MRILDEIRRQHRDVERIAGSLQRWAERGVGHPDAASDLATLVAVTRTFVFGHHHLVEETLFRALVEYGEVPEHAGPIAVLRREHEAAAEAVGRLEACGTDQDAVELGRKLAAALWGHLDKEESVLLPEAERRLIDGGVRELDVPAAAGTVDRSLRALEELADRLPPVDDPELIRGDGCVACDAFTVHCHGIEAEWWSDWERLHHASLDEG